MKLLFVIAVLPAALLFRYVNKKDWLDAESGRLRIRLAIFGALSAIPSVIIELTGARLTIGVGSELAALIINDMIVVALAEEGCKYLILRLMTWNSGEFNCAYDGLLYAVYISLGFALIENIIFVFSYGVVTGLLRAFTAVPGHCFFGVLMGTMYASAKRADLEHDKKGCARYGVCALAVPAFVHGLYDLLIELDSTASLSAFIVLLIAIYVVGFRLIKRTSENDFYFATGTVIPPDPDQTDKYDMKIN